MVMLQDRHSGGWLRSSMPDIPRFSANDCQSWLRFCGILPHDRPLGTAILADGFVCSALTSPDALRSPRDEHPGILASLHAILHAMTSVLACNYVVVVGAGACELDTLPSTHPTGGPPKTRQQCDAISGTIDRHPTPNCQGT
jgi:hypothetical protein